MTPKDTQTALTLVCTMQAQLAQATQNGWSMQTLFATVKQTASATLGENYS